MTDRCVLKPKDQEHLEFYKSWIKLRFFKKKNHIYLSSQDVYFTVKYMKKTGTGQKSPNIEIIIQSYYICFILRVILKDILKN
jgi:hypothetical protein